MYGYAGTTRGFRLFKRLKKVKMKMRQHDTDEAGDYGDAVPVKFAPLGR